jgi:hypothetical protein
LIPVIPAGLDEKENMPVWDTEAPPIAANLAPMTRFWFAEKQGKQAITLKLRKDKSFIKANSVKN